MSQDQSPPLEWRKDVPIAQGFDDPYFSLDDGVAETQHVFLAGNGLPQRFSDGFRIAELGFGTGLNLLVTLQAWRASHQTGMLHFTSFEAFPMLPADMIRAQSAFPELAELARELAPHWGQNHITLPDLQFHLITGDARQTLPHWQGCADAWYLDGFNPAKNPELWEEGLLDAVGTHTAAGGSFATYTAAGFVRRGLAQAGFAVERVSGYGRKRHMTKGVKP